MSSQNGRGGQLRIYRLPGWAVPILAMVGLAIILLAGLVSLTLLVFLIPVGMVVMLLTGLYLRLFGGGAPQAAGSRTSGPEYGHPSVHRTADTIEVDYEVIEPHAKPSTKPPGGES